MQFPHLGDTRFPNLQTVNVYEFKNEFDYTRWSEKTKIKLCNVMWHSDYSDVVKFDTNAERDNWFDSLTDIYTVELETAARVVPEGYVKLPIPYDVMARFNYMFLDMPIVTSNVNKIDYETNDGVKRWYFFIDRIVYLSPNTTQAFVVPDAWTIFQNDIDIRYLLLERGHAPVAASDTDEYLANPIANNDYLLAPDVSFDNAGITRSADFVPFGNGTKYVCIASTCAPEQIQLLGAVFVDPAYAPFGVISYSDVDQRYGYQLQVNGFSIGSGLNFSNARTPAKVGHSNNNRIANNLSIYAIEATECYGNGTFFSDIILQCPQFLNTVQACFVVDEACLTFGTRYEIAGHYLYRCIGTQRHLLTKQLHKSDFGYPSEYERFAKLYTSPYAQLEITDNDGNIFTINVEETSVLNVESVVAVAFPYVNMRVFIDGIGGTGSSSYTWADLNGNVASLEMSNSDWFKYCFDWKIPTFSLFMDGETAYQLNSFNRNIVQGINNAIVAYHNTMRTANTAYENACDAADAAYDNTTDSAETNRDNSYRSADTGKINADNSADTSHTNAYNSANTGKLNADNSAYTAQQNANNLSATAKTNADSSAAIAKANTNRITATNKTNADNAAQTAYDVVDNTATCQTNNLAVSLSEKGTLVGYENAAASAICRLGQDKAFNATLFANRLCQYTTNVDIEKSTSCSLYNNISTIAGGAIAGATTTSVLGAGVGAAIGSAVPVVGNLSAGAVGAIGGAVVGAVGGGITAAMNSANVAVTTNSAQSITDAQTNYNSNVTSAGNQYTEDIQDEMNALKTDSFNNAISPSETQQQANAVATSRANATAQKNTTNTNAANIKNAEDTNALDNYNLATTIAANNKTTSDTNAANTKATANTNAANTAQTSKDNADNTMNTAKTNATNTKNTSRQNALDSYNTTVANAERTKDNIKDNSSYTREANELNAKELLENAANNSMAGLLDARNAQPRQIGSYSGDADADYMRTRGVQIKVKTQSDSAIRQAGDFFVRYGYAYNQIWDVHTSGLKLMNHFTYWKAEEIWVDDRQSSNNAVEDFIKQMFLNGVTVWNSPTEIGRIDVYTN